MSKPPAEAGPLTPWLPETATRDITRLRSDRLHRIETAKATLEELRPIIEEQIWPPKTWQDAAFDLLFIFEKAMRTVYPDRRFGHSLGGPAVQFIYRLFPRVAGVKKTEATISTELKRGHRDRDKSRFAIRPGDDTPQIVFISVRSPCIAWHLRRLS